MDDAEIEAFNAMSDGEKWRHILVEYLDHLRPVPAHFVRWILVATAPDKKSKEERETWTIKTTRPPSDF